MKNLLVYLVLAIACVLLAARYEKNIAAFAYSSPCDTPIPYKIGEIDQGFHVTYQEFKDDISQAARIWDSAYGKQLFTFDGDATLSVNYIFDERQALTNQINNLDGQLNNEKSALSPQMQEYQTKVHEFQQQLSDLNSQIAYWNSKGGAPKDVYDKLVAQQQSLQQEAAQLNQMAQSLNRATDVYNAQVGQLNQTEGSLNQVTQTKPEEGLFDPNPPETISIYYNHGHDELVHTLAHELGHALGMQHVKDPNAIMYTETNTNTTPTADDVTELQKVCRKQTAFDRIGQWVATIKQNIQSQ